MAKKNKKPTGTPNVGLRSSSALKRRVMTRRNRGKAATSTATRTASRSPTPVRTASRSPTPVRTASHSPTPVRTASRSPTPVRTDSRSPTPVRTDSRSPTLVRTDSRSPTPIRTDSRFPSPIRTDSRSPTPVRTDSRSPSPIRTDSRSPSPISTDSRSPSPIRTDSRSPTPTRTASRSSSPHQDPPKVPEFAYADFTLDEFIIEKGWYHVFKYFVAASRLRDAEKDLTDFKKHLLDLEETKKRTEHELNCVRGQLVTCKDTMELELKEINDIGRVLVRTNKDAGRMINLLLAGYVGVIVLDRAKVSHDLLELMIKCGGKIEDFIE